jgi:uncharacterized protein (DUF2147 family)
MRIVRTAVVGVSVLLLSVSVRWAADSNANATASPTAAKTEPAAAKTGATAAPGGATAIKDAIVGNWRCAVDGEVMEFAADGSARVKDPNAMFMATYKILDDGSLHLEVPAFANQKDFVYQMELTGDQLTLTLKDQKPRTYDRIK